MAWTRTWPKGADDEIALEDLNDLNDELNLRAGLANASFTEGVGLRRAIFDMRERVILAASGAPGFLNDEGYLYHNSAYLEEASYGEGYWRRINLFTEVFGAERSGWRNDLAGTEVPTDGNLEWPPECSLADSEPYIFHLNELYTVIDHLEYAVVPKEFLGLLEKAGVVEGEASHAAALAAAWAEVQVAEATLYYDTDTNYHTYSFQHFAAASWNVMWNYKAYIKFYQPFMSVAVPADTVSARVFFHYYSLIQVGGGDQLTLHVGTDDPGELGDEDWDYGEAVAGVVDLPATEAEPVAPLWSGEHVGVWGADLENLTPGEVNYIRAEHTILLENPLLFLAEGYGAHRKHNTTQESYMGIHFAVKRF